MPQQSEMQFTLVTEGGPAWEVVKFTLTEALSQPFRLELDLASLSASVDFDALLDSPATFTIHRDGAPVRVVHGILTGLEQGQTGFRRTRYKAVIEPALVRLSLRQNSRIFQRKAVPDILKTLLTEQRVAERQFDLVGAHLSREYCVQHRESDARFFDRLAAEEGLLYYFEPGETTRLMLTDAIATGPTLGGEVPYQPAPGGDAAAPRLWHFAYRQQLAPTRAVQRDYTFKNPPYDLQQQAQARDGIGEYEHYEAPGRYKQDEAGKPFTATRLEALRREARTAIIEGDDARLWPGLSFALADHPNADLNTDWRVVSMAHEGEQSASQEQDGAGADIGSRYRYRAQVVPAQSDWKPAPPPRPVMDGPQIAHVVGPPGEEIHVDEHGRVMVWFPWDRAGKKEDSTCWLRVSQGWAGASYGMVALPRIGHEVIVDFLEGDPDQPLVTGRSYHAANRPPYALPQHKTRSTWKSQTHKGEGSNEIRYEDEAGQEEIYVHAQRDQNNVVEHDETTRVGHDRTENVGNDERITIGHDRQESVGNDETVTIGNHRSVTVGGAKIETIALAKAETIGLGKALSIGAAYQVSVGAAMNATIGLSKSEQVMLDKSTSVGENNSTTVGQNKSLDVGKKFNTVVGEEYVLKVGKASLVMKSDGTVILKGVKFEFDATGKISITAKKNIKMKGQKILEN